MKGRSSSNLMLETLEFGRFFGADDFYKGHSA